MLEAQGGNPYKFRVVRSQPWILSRPIFKDSSGTFRPTKKPAPGSSLDSRAIWRRQFGARRLAAAWFTKDQEPFRSILHINHPFICIEAASRPILTRTFAGISSVPLRRGIHPHAVRIRTQRGTQFSSADSSHSIKIRHNGRRFSCPRHRLCCRRSKFRALKKFS